MKAKYYITGMMLALCVSAFALDVNVRDYGARGDGSNIDSDAINRAINDVSAAGGGVVLIPSGTYRCRSIRLKSNVTLRLDGATIIGTSGIDAPESNSANDDYQDFGHSHFRNALIWGENLTNIKIIGRGTINGNGALSSSDSPGSGIGDKAISLKLCTNVEVGGLDGNNRLTMTRFGHFAILATGDDNVSIHDIYVPNVSSAQRDFLDLMQCNDVTVNNITVDWCNDDIIKLGSDYSLGFRRSSSNIFVSNITGKTNCNVVMIGSETVAPISNVHFTNITGLGAGKAGIGIMSNDGSIVDGVTVRDMTMTGSTSPIYIKITNRGRAPNASIGRIRNVTITNVTAVDSESDNGEYTSVIAGYKEGSTIVNLENITLNNVNISSPGGHPGSDTNINPPELEDGDYNLRYMGTRPSYGIYFRHTRGVKLNGVEMSYVSSDGRPAIVAENSNTIEFNDVTAERGSGRNYDILFRDASTYCLSNSPSIIVSGGTSITCTGGDTAPTAPGALTATAISSGQINLSWTDNADNETSFRIERSTDAGSSWTLLTITSSNTTAYSDTNVAASTTYHYRVRAENAAGNSAFSNVANATTLGSGTLPSIGTGITQAEALNKSGFEENVFEGVTCVRALSTTPGFINGTFTAAAGSYTITIRPFDEDDGAATFTLKVNGTTLGTRTLSVNDNTWKDWIVNNVTLATDDEIRIEGARESGEHARIDYIQIAGAGGGSGNIYLEAESGTITAPMQVQTGAAASGGQYITVAAGNNSNASAPAGRATYTFTIPAAGTYKIWGRTICPTTSDDSFWVRVDNGTWINWNEITVSTTWIWDDVHDAANDDVVMSYTLAAGVHTVDVAYREDGAQLDRILITNDLSLNPNTSIVSTGMDSSGSVVTADEQEASPGEESGIIISPNPAAGKITIYFKVKEDGQVKVLLYNGVDHRSQLVIDNHLSAGTHSATFDASLLPAGIHIIRVMEKGSEKTTRLLKQ